MIRVSQSYWLVQPKAPTGLHTGTWQQMRDARVVQRANYAKLRELKVKTMHQRRTKAEAETLAKTLTEQTGMEFSVHEAMALSF